MATIGLTNAPTHVRVASLASIKTKYAGDVARYPLGKLQDGEITIKTISTGDNRDQPNAFALDLKAGAKCLYFDKTNFLPLLASLGHTPMDTVFTDADGTTYGVTCGMAVKFVCDGDIDKHCYFDVMADYSGPIDNGSTSYTDLDAILATPSADGTPTITDTLYALNSLSGALTPAGFADFALRPRADSTFESVGPINNCKLTIEPVTYQDQWKRTLVQALMVTASCESKAVSTELAMLKNVVSVDAKITLMNGTVLTFDDKVGVDWEYSGKGNMKEPRSIMFTVKGTLLLSELAGIIS